MGQLSHPHLEELVAAAAAPCQELWQSQALGGSRSQGGPQRLTAAVKVALPPPGPGSLWGL